MGNTRAATKNSGRKSGKFQPGPDSRRGNGPEKGAPNAGRPPNEFKQWCKGLLDDPKCRTQVEEILNDKKHPAFPTMFRIIADRAHGKPPESVDFTSGGEAVKYVTFDLGTKRVR